MGMFKQRAPVRTQSPTLAEIYWAAGFLEGEGCFSSREQQHPKWKNTTVLGVDVLAVQVQKEPLERLQRWFGGSLKQRIQGVDKRNPDCVRRSIWCWSLTSSRGIALMMTLLPLMSPWRQEQIKKAIRMWRARPLKRHWAHCSRGHDFTEANTRLKNGKDGFRYRKCRACDALYRRIETARRRLRQTFGASYKGNMGLVLNGSIKNKEYA